MVVRKKFTRKELQHDQLVDTVSVLAVHLQRYRRVYFFALTAALAVALILSLATVRRARDRAEAARLLARAETFGELAAVYENHPATPAAPLALMTAAAHLFREGNQRQALASYRAFLDRYPAHPAAPAAALGAAYSLEALEEWSEALEMFGRVAAEYPRNSAAPEAVYGRARILLLLNRRDQARAAFDELISRYPWSMFSQLARERRERLEASPFRLPAERGSPG